MRSEVNFSYKAHPKQALIHADPHRFRVLVAGRRFGKSWVAVAEAIYWSITHPNSLIWIMAPSYRQAKTFAWPILMKLLPYGTLQKKNEQDLDIVLKNGSQISLKGTERVDLLRGVGLDGVIMDEVAYMKDGTWESVVRPMLVDKNGWALFTGTPKGFNYFWKLAKLGDHNGEIEGDPIDILGHEEGEKLLPDPAWKTFRFTTYDNPHIPPNEIESTKAVMNDDFFAQEHLAAFTSFTGLIYNTFSPAMHVTEPFDIPPHWLRAVGVDIGFNHASSAIFLAVDEKGSLYVYDEIFTERVTTSEFLDMLRPRLEGKYHQIKTCDASAADFKERARQMGMWFTSPERPEGSRQYGWVQESINWVKDYLKPGEDGKPKLKVFNHCKNLIREFQTYVWDEKRVASERPQPKKIKDDAVDALRYAVMELRGRKASREEFEYYVDRDKRPMSVLANQEWDVARL